MQPRTQSVGNTGKPSDWSSAAAAALACLLSPCGHNPRILCSSSFNLMLGHSVAESMSSDFNSGVSLSTNCPTGISSTATTPSPLTETPCTRHRASRTLSGCCEGVEHQDKSIWSKHETEPEAFGTAATALATNLSSFVSSSESSSHRTVRVSVLRSNEAQILSGFTPEQVYNQTCERPLTANHSQCDAQFRSDMRGSEVGNLKAISWCVGVMFAWDWQVMEHAAPKVSDL